MRCYFSGHFLRLPVGPGDTQASGEASETPLHDQSGFDGFLLFLASLNTHNDHSALSTCVLCPHWAHFTRCLIQIKSTLCFLRIHKNVLRYFTWASLTSLMLYNVNQLRVSGTCSCSELKAPRGGKQVLKSENWEATNPTALFCSHILSWIIDKMVWAVHLIKLKSGFYHL